MASNTENLDLLMKNPSTDGADTFNVQTMLNENWQKIDNNAGTVAQTLANILKPTTPPIIGLPSSATPNDMFNVLAHAGDLHVWRKTVKTSSDTPAGYTLGDTLTHGNSFIVRQTTGTGYVDAVIQEASSISVNDNGVISASWGGTITLRYGNSVTFTPGRFVKIYSINTKALSSFAVDDVVWVPSDGGIQMNFSNDYGYYIEFTKCQKVNAHGIIPAGTTVTYPVSTNRNAYQEGNDAKPAGYTLGDVVTGRFMLEGSYRSSHPTYYYADNTPTVSDDGVVSVKDIYGFSGYGSGQDALQTRIRGKYIQCRVDNYTQSDFRNLGVVYIPEDAVVLQYSSVDGVYIDRYQPVTGYAAIPANTTIEYLGCLGDKARVQFGSYVGTGTYGSSNPNTLTFDFVPKMVFVWGFGNSSGNSLYYQFMFYGEVYTSVYTGDGNGNGTSVSWDSKTVSWYTNNRYAQLNESSRTYRFFAIC